MALKRAGLLPFKRTRRRLDGARIVFLRLRLLMLNTSSSCDRLLNRERAKGDRDNRDSNRAGDVAVLGTRGEAEAALIVTPLGYD